MNSIFDLTGIKAVDVEGCHLISGSTLYCH